jgi:hypothetical protein
MEPLRSHPRHVGGAYCGGSGDPADMERHLIVWYKFHGTGLTVRMNSTEPFAIFVGSCDDLWDPFSGDDFGDNDSLECRSACGGSYAFKTEEDMIYYVYMATCPCGHCTEEFTVSVEEVQGPSNHL